jgi:hypothetical protein
MSFPHANIHELVTPDLLHQLVKGVFKDHIFEWVLEWIQLLPTEAAQNRVLDDIDRRYV